MKTNAAGANLLNLIGGSKKQQPTLLVRSPPSRSGEPVASAIVDTIVSRALTDCREKIKKMARKFNVEEPSDDKPWNTAVMLKVNAIAFKKH